MSFENTMAKGSNDPMGRNDLLTIQIKRDDLGMVLVSSVRYALGRHTYIPSWTAQVIKQFIHELTINDLHVMLRDIHEYLSLCSFKDNHREFNDQCWLSLGEVLEKEYEDRN